MPYTQTNGQDSLQLQTHRQEQAGTNRRAIYRQCVSYILTFRSLCTMSCWWIWWTLSRIWWIQWLWRQNGRKEKGEWGEGGEMWGWIEWNQMIDEVMAVHWTKGAGMIEKARWLVQWSIYKRWEEWRKQEREEREVNDGSEETKPFRHETQL